MSALTHPRFHIDGFQSMDYNQRNSIIDPRLELMEKKSMSVPDSLKGLTGCWEGTSRLWLTPDDPVRESKTTATLELVAQNRFATLSYTWSEGGKPQDGLLLLGVVDDLGATEAVWVDSNRRLHRRRQGAHPVTRHRRP